MLTRKCTLTPATDSAQATISTQETILWITLSCCCRYVLVFKQAAAGALHSRNALLGQVIGILFEKVKQASYYKMLFFFCEGSSGGGDWQRGAEVRKWCVYILWRVCSNVAIFRYDKELPENILFKSKTCNIALLICFLCMSTWVHNSAPVSSVNAASLSQGSFWVRGCYKPI